MEAAGLTVGVIALAGLFNNAVQCFEFVQLSRNFGKDFQTCQLKLDIAQLRLSRWGAALGLSDQNQGIGLLGEHFNPQTVEKAKALLDHILHLFNEAEIVSKKYISHSRVSEDRLMMYDPRNDMDPLTANIHDKVRQLSVGRQNRTSLLQKAKWALHEEKPFRRLIEDVVELTTTLIDTFPATQKTLQALCDHEVSVIGSQEVNPALTEVVTEQDGILADAILRVAKSTGGNHNTIFSGDNNSGLQVSHNAGTISGITFGKRY